MGYYRFLNHKEVTVPELTMSSARQCQTQVEGRHILAISDSSEVNLQAQAGRLKPEHLGKVGKAQSPGFGFWLHPTLAVDAESGLPLGLSAIQIWHREVEQPDKRQRRYKQLPIEAKESYKWIKAATDSQPYFEAGGATQVTYIGDREADIYEEWFDVPQLGAQLLVRVGQERTLMGTQEKLSAHIAQQPVQGTYAVVVPKDPRLQRPEREAFMRVRYSRVSIRRPKRLSAEVYPASVTLSVVDAQEVSPPAGVEPLHWCLLTTHRVETLEQALQILQWYRWRWRIEQLFAILKQPGLEIEATQLESGRAIQSLCVLALTAAVRILQLVEGRDDDTQPALLVFPLEQQQCLDQIAPTLEGRTRKQQNPHPPQSLAWAAWCIARLGGWSGYSSQPPPGIQTILRGLQKFDSFFAGWSSNRLMYTQ
jgi:hypothetical protein